MPIETMDQRNMPPFYKPAVPSSMFSEEMYIPSEKHVGFWKTASMPDRRGLDAMSTPMDFAGLDAMSNMSGGKPISSLPLENFKNNFVDHIEPLMDPVNTSNYQRTSNSDVASHKVVMEGGYYESSLFSSSMSDLFNRARGLTSKDGWFNQSANEIHSNFDDDEPIKISEEIEAQAIGDLLPNDDELLFGSTDDDLFCSVGGLELESDDNIKFCSKMTSKNDYSRIFSSQEERLNKKNQSSRMLIVRNVDSNIEDTELRVLFEQYGDIQAFHTFYKHLGIVMVSYYDIRAAQNAERMLHAMTVKGQKLDVQFYTLKETPENKTSNGVVLISNLDMPILNDGILHIFGQIGEIKDICEVPQNRKYKIIEFYDVRAGDTALSALNGYEIAGKRIKVEPLHLGDLKLSSTQKGTMDLELEESGRSRHEIYPQKIPLGYLGTSSNNQNGAVHGSIDPRNFRSPSSIPRKIPSQPTSLLIGNSNGISGNCELSHSLGKLNLGSQSMPSFPKINDGVPDGIQFNSPNTISAMAMDMNSTPVANGSEHRSIHRSGSFAHSSHFEHNKSAFNSAIGSFPPNSHEHIWNESSLYHHPGSGAWQSMQPFIYNNNIPVQTPHVLHGLSRGLSHVPNHVSTPNQNIGSAPSLAFHPNHFSSVGYSTCSPLHQFDLSSQNLYSSMGGLTMESSVPSTHAGTPPSQPRAHIYRTKSNVSTSRGRRSHSHVNQSDSSGQYDLDVDRIARGEELRTTLMIKNIPNKYTSKMLLATIDEQHKGTYDFIYLPIDFKNKCNVGYAFINMTDPQHIIPFYQAFNGKKWEKFNSGKVAYLAYARIQGKSALIGHFQNSSLMNEDKRCRPILFRTEGPNAGEQEPFPVPVGASTRVRRSRQNTRTNHGSASNSSSDDESPNFKEEKE